MQLILLNVIPVKNGERSKYFISLLNFFFHFPPRKLLTGKWKLCENCPPIHLKHGSAILTACSWIKCSFSVMLNFLSFRVACKNSKSSNTIKCSSIWCSVMQLSQGFISFAFVLLSFSCKFSFCLVFCDFWQTTAVII